MKWSTDFLLETLIHLCPKGTRLSIHDPGGDYDTFGLRIAPAIEEEDGISIIGFSHILFEEFEEAQAPRHDIPYVEIRNFHSDSDGGLSIYASGTIRDLYFIAIDYFKNQQVDIVRNMKDYF